MRNDEKGIIVDNKNGMIEALKVFGTVSRTERNINSAKVFSHLPSNFEANLLCPTCGDNRKCLLNNLRNESSFEYEENGKSVEFGELPIIYRAKCLQCDSEAILILYSGPNDLELAVLGNSYGGSVTKYTPSEIKYYIDQAYRARSVGALSAAMAMYRSSLEWLLYDQGYEKGMLGEKIKNLEEDINNNKGPDWAKMLNVKVLELIKNIGNSAIHTNGGNIEKQIAINEELIKRVDIVFSELFDIIYETPMKRKKNLEKLEELEKNL